MDVSKVLATAWEQVEKAKLPESLRDVAFREAVQLLTAGEVHLDGTDQDLGSPAMNRGNRAAPRAPRKAVGTPKASSSKAASFQESLPPMAEKDFFSKVAHETGVPVEKLERVFHLEGGLPQLSVKPNQLGSNLKERMVTVAQAVCVVRAVAYGEDGTSMKVIRAECRRLRSLDDKNINKHLSEIDGLVYVGPTRDRRLKVRPAVENAFPGVIERLLGNKAVNDDQQS